MPCALFSQVLAVESSKSSITPGAPEFSIFTTRSASSAGPVIWLRWSAHHAGSSILQELIVATDGGRYEGTLPAWASAKAYSRRAKSALCRRVRAACKGPRKSRNPSGRSRSGSKSFGAVLTGTTRLEKGSGVSAGLSFAVAVAIMFFQSFPKRTGRTGWQLQRAIRFPTTVKCLLLSPTSSTGWEASERRRQRLRKDWDKELRNLHTLALCFPIANCVFNRLNTCSTSTSFLPCRNTAAHQMLFSILNNYSIL